MKLLKKTRLFTWMLASSLLIIQGCKDPNIGGRDVLPSSDLIQIKYTDTLSLHTDTHLIDSVQTSALDFHLLGNYIDEDMGRINTATYAQFRFAGDQFSFGDLDSLRADSLILFVDLVGYFGRVESRQNLLIQEIKGAMSDTATYYSNDTLATYPTDLSGGLPVNNTTGALKDIRIKLDPQLAEKLLQTPDSNRTSQAAFLRYFKGLKIGTHPLTIFNVREPGAIFYASFNSSNTRLTLHYSKKDASGNYSKQLKYDYYVTTASRQFHHIKRNDYANRTLGQELNHPNRPHTFEFIQSGAFAQTWVKIPHIHNLGKIGINNATLYLKADPTTLGVALGNGYRFTPPAIEVYLPDTSLKAPASSFVYSAVPFDTKTNAYIIPLNGYVQRLVNGQVENRGVIIRPTDQLNYLSTTVNRAVVGGMGNTSLKPELRLTYTTLPE